MKTRADTTAAPRSADALRARLEATGMTLDQADALAEQLQRRQAADLQYLAAGRPQQETP